MKTDDSKPATFEIKVCDQPGMTAWAAEFVDALKALPQHVAQALLDRFELLLRQAVVEIPEGSHIAADGTRHGGISLRVVGTAELLAAARAAA